jgi:hypothetical protein
MFTNTLITNGAIQTQLTNKLSSSRNGYAAAKAGQKYELLVHNLVQKCYITTTKQMFNTQAESEIGGFTADNDITCNWVLDRDLPIEIKKSKTPDWMQCSLKYNKDTKEWFPSTTGKIPIEARALFQSILNNQEYDKNNKKLVFNGKIPSFLMNPMTHFEWKQEKEQSHDFRDHYISCPNDTIEKLYRAKGCNYIQISDKGLYYLGEDKCKFNVPRFICDQQVRIRIKTHSKKNKKGFCSLSVMLACQPININQLKNSQYSLDTIDRLPKILNYQA